MSNTLIRITAASRLHFGLFSFGRRGPNVREFGGVGMMIHQPGLRVSIEPAKQFQATGQLADRVVKFVARWANVNTSDIPPACHVCVELAPPQHSGLGVGTQLGLSVAAGLNAFYCRPVAAPHQLAKLTARGVRSAIGVYGFFRGGLIVEDGKLPDETLSPLLNHCAVPAVWRVVLIRPRQAVGLSGKTERATFRNLPPVDARTSQSLRDEVNKQMLAALNRADFDAFSESVYRFGRAAGQCFAQAQGGAYNGPVLNEIVEASRCLGVRGVGQSSWGPTIFCFLPDETTAVQFVEEIRKALPAQDLDVCISRPCNQGALITRAD